MAVLTLCSQRNIDNHISPDYAEEVPRKVD